MKIGKSKKQTWPIRLFGSIFIIVGLAVMGMGIRSFIKTQQAAHWPSTAATITHLELDSRTNDGSTTYSLDVRYQYTVNGQRYSSEQLDFSFGSDSNRDYWEQTKKKLQKDRKKKRAVCYYNPDQPSEAVLIREPRLWTVLFTGGFGFVFCLAGSLVAFGIPALTRMQQRRKEQRAELSNPDNLADIAGKRHPLPITSLKVTAGFFSGFALFWNGISWFLFVMFLIDKKDEVFPIIFLVGLFPLIGIFLALAALFSIRNWLRQRQFEYALPHGPLPAGGKGDLELFNLPRAQNWEMQIAETRPRRTKHGGADTMNEPSVLWSYDLRVNDDEVRQADGSIRLPIALPADARSESGDFGIRWQLIFSSKATGKVRIDLPIADSEPGPLTREMISEAVVDPELAAQADKQEQRIVFDTANNRLYLRTRWQHGFVAKCLGMLFGSIFAGIGIAVWFHGAPIIFPIIFGGLGGLLVLFCLWHLITSSDITIDSSGLRGSSQTWFFRRHYDLQPPGFSDCQARSNMQSGNTHYFTITVEHAGHRVVVMRNHKDQARVRRAVELIRNVLDIESSEQAVVIPDRIRD